MKNIIKEEADETKEILGKIRSRDFSGNTGQVIKNSGYQLSTTLVAKIGSLLFTIIIARLMLPELYGLYGLALSTILLLSAFGDMGVGPAMQTFLSKKIDKSPGKAKGYFLYLTKAKAILVAISMILVVLIGRWLATNYYQKPIYYALLAGAFYFPMVAIQTHLTSFFTAKNNFKPILIKEIILQTTRIILIPLLIIFLLSKIISQEIFLLWVFAALTFCYFIAAAYLFLRVKREALFKKSKTINLSKKEKASLKKFILPLTVTALSGVFFGYIDQIMLGHYVESAFIGFYQASFNLVASAALIVAFSSTAVFPILARLKGKALERGFRKVRNITGLLSILAAIATFILAPLIIKLIYGPAYISAVIYLQIFSMLIISFPLTSLYSTYYTTQERTRTLSILLIFSTILNIILNYTFINIGLGFSMSYAVMGACIATIMSQYSYLGGLIIFRKWKRIN